MPLPTRTPNHSIIWPATNGDYDYLEFTGGVTMNVTAESGLHVGSDSHGRFLTCQFGQTGVYFDSDVPPLDGARSFAMRMRSYVTLDVSDGPLSANSASVESSISAGVLTSNNLNTGDPNSGLWRHVFYTQGSTNVEQVTNVDYPEKWFSLVAGGTGEWGLSDPWGGNPDIGGTFDGSPSSLVMGSGPRNLRIERASSAVNPGPRIYAWDIWYDFPAAPAMWTTRQRQTAPANAGGWPLRQRHNGGFTGGWPLRQRQTGL